MAARLMWEFSKLSSVEASRDRDEYFAKLEADVARKTKDFVTTLIEGHGDDEAIPETEEERQERLYIEAL